MPEPDMSVWTGRVDVADGPRALRWHQNITRYHPGEPPGIVLIGFACDEGIRRNHGRVGARDGPPAIRRSLANLAWHQPTPVYDAGDVACDEGDLEGAQSQLAEVVAEVIASGHRPLVLGGGHETAWGTFQGIVQAKPKAKVGVINIDAHLDLRADEPGNSGTPFYQIAKWCEAKGQPFKYICLGVAEPANTLALMERAGSLGVSWVSDVHLAPWELEPHHAFVEEFLDSVESLHLSIDLDVLPAAVMPAVSAPAAYGVALESVEQLVGRILESGKTAAVDLVELNPSLDADDCGARVASRLAWHVVQTWGLWSSK